MPLLTHVQNSSGVWPVFKHRAWEDLRATEKPPSYRASYAAGKENPTVPVRTAMTANVTLRFMLLYRVPKPVLEAAAEQVTAAAAAGALTALPAHRFALDDVVAAHEAVEAGVTGKVLVDIG